eukprot:scaffold112175_cov33-Tisochrysis_lutea.AAC.4
MAGDGIETYALPAARIHRVHLVERLGHWTNGLTSNTPSLALCARANETANFSVASRVDSWITSLCSAGRVVPGSA